MSRAQPLSFGQRIFRGTLILLALCVGFYLSWPTIAYDMPRMFHWQQILFWVADVGAVLCVLRWMFVEPFQTIDRRKSNGRLIAILILVSLVLDICCTGASFYSISQGIERSLETEAKVTSVSEDPRDDMRQVRLEVTYKDQHQQVHQTSLSFIEVFGRPVHAWEKQPLAIATRQDRRETIDVIYDPQLPARVWFKGQPFDSVSGISVNFMLIHIAQTIFVLWLCSGLITNDLQVDPRNTVYLLVPIIIEAGVLVFLGLLTWKP